MKKYIEDLRILAGFDYPTTLQEDESEVEEAGKVDTMETIKVLADTDYREKDAFFKLVQLLKGLASVSDKDEMAKMYLSKVSDALTDVTKKMMKDYEESVSKEKGDGDEKGD